MAIGEKQAGLVLHDEYAGVDPFLHTLPQTGMGGLGLHIERIVAAVQADAHGLVQLLRSAAQRADEQRVCNGREFRRHKLIACALAADAATGNDDVPGARSGCTPPQVPTRITASAPAAASSSSAAATQAQPMPLLVTAISAPPGVLPV